MNINEYLNHQINKLETAERTVKDFGLEGKPTESSYPYLVALMDYPYRCEWSMPEGDCIWYYRIAFDPMRTKFHVLEPSGKVNRAKVSKMTKTWFYPRQIEKGEYILARHEAIKKDFLEKCEELYPAEFIELFAEQIDDEISDIKTRLDKSKTEFAKSTVSIMGRRKKT